MVESPLKSVWISNCACVLSSIGNVAKYFEKVYPSPFNQEAPSVNHLFIAKEISDKYRSQIAINETAYFDENKFVFEGSVSDTVFQKNSDDKRFHHRDIGLTNFYKSLLNFDRGDEVLQIGQVSLFTFPKYIIKQMSRKIKQKPKFEEEAGLYVG